MTGKKVAHVTGASPGIGKITAKQLLDDELIIYAAARYIEKMKDLEELGPFAIKMDIIQKENVQNVVATIEENHGGVRVGKQCGLRHLWSHREYLHRSCSAAV